MKCVKWRVILYSDEDKTRIVGVHHYHTIREMAYVLDVRPSVISNFFHKLIAPRSTLRYVDVVRVDLKCC
jgi:hypothetical protein